jgi:hypothetical protein
MNILFKILPHNLPTFLRQEILAELFKATADAFACPVVPLRSEGQALYHLSIDERLRAYALFTKEHAEKALQSGCDVADIKARLYQNAFPLGRMLSKWLAVNTMEEMMALGQILYRALGIEIQGDSAGETRGNVIVKRCYFSQFYSSAVCDLISALDDGIFSGLSGGGRLVFSERLTEGSEQGVPRECCRAKILFGE